MKNRQYDLIVMGATGFTGKLVVEYLLKTYGINNPEFSWAIAARDNEKLNSLKESLVDIDNKSIEIPVILADSHDKKSLDKSAVLIGPEGGFSEKERRLDERRGDKRGNWVVRIGNLSDNFREQAGA